MKRYHILVLFNSTFKILEWMEQEKKNASKVISHELGKHNRLILEYDFDWESGDKVSQVSYEIVQYFQGTKQYSFAYRFAGGQYYDVRYIDGMFDAFDITYLSSRTRLGVEEI